uniref:Uncharacterized protein n=1 Tax=Anguilla anguilla TaxID=7936 RepID=A0A0E9QN80_ANGAN
MEVSMCPTVSSLQLIHHEILNFI